MPINVEIQDSQIEGLVGFYVERLKAIKSQIAELEAETRQINSTIQNIRRSLSTRQLTISQDKEFSTNTNYSEKWTWVKKITFAINSLDRPLTSKEIVDFLTDFESSFLFDRKKAIASVSSTLSTRSSDGQDFDKIKRESGEMAYFLRPQSTENAEIVEVDDLPF